MCDGFDWDVEQAPRNTVPCGSSRPKGTLHIEDPVLGVEFRPVPACVAREIARRRKSGEMQPQSRGELVAQVDALCESMAMGRVASLIGRRDYPESDVVGRLRQDGFDADLAQRVTRRAVDIGLVSDARYSDAFIRTKIGAGWGLERIERELSQRGVDVSGLKGWPYEYSDPDDEMRRAVEVASRKTVREPNSYAKMVRFLLGRGYGYGVATSAAKEVLGR